jgi:hypothetical protein
MVLKQAEAYGTYIHTKATADDTMLQPQLMVHCYATYIYVQATAFSSSATHTVGDQYCYAT